MRTFLALACLPFAVLADEASISVEKARVAPDETVVVTYRGFPGKAKDWITVVAKDAAEDTYGQYFYTDGKPEGSFTFAALKPGDYEARGYFDWPDGGYKVEVRAAFTVSESDGAAEAPQPPESAEPAPAAQGTVFFTREPGDLFSAGLDGNGCIQWAQGERCARPALLGPGVLFLSVQGMDAGLSFLDRGTRKTKVLVAPGRREGVKAAAGSPDGRSVACILGDGFKNDVYLLGPDGKRTKLTSVEGMKEGPLSWSPDGRDVLFTLHPPRREAGGATDYSVKQVARASSDGSGDQVLASEEGDSDAAAFSPDGRSIVFVHCGIKSQEGNVRVMSYPEIWVMAADGSGKRKLTDGKSWDYQPAWSPDGRSIAFISSRSAGYDNVFVMDADGSGVRQLTKQDYAKKMHPVWSKDGRSVCYLSEESFKRKLHAVPAAGGDSVEIAEGCVDFDVAE